MRFLSPPPSRIPLIDIVNKAVSNSRIWMTYIYEMYRFVQIEDWHEVGAANEPAFQNSWANAGGANDETAAFRLQGVNNLHIKGLVSGGTITDGTVLFTLPEKYWPEKTLKVASMYVQGSSENSYQIELQTDGDLVIYGVSGAAPVLSLHARVDIRNG